MLHTQWEGATLENQHWTCPQKPISKPSLHSIPTGIPASQETSAQKVSLKLRFATCNVLTLRSATANRAKTHAGAEGPARMEWILKSFDDLGIHIFSLQETRLRTIRQTEDDRYILFKSSATPPGQYGISVGFSKKHSFAVHHDQNGQEASANFRVENISIITAEPRLLILKLQTLGFKCVLLAAHAPHTGAELHEIDEFWHHVEACIPQYLADWPRVILADANCRLGSQPCQHIGGWQAETMTDKSGPFSQFIAKSNVFLPSTFEQFHEGEGGTWQHQLGMRKRNDYIGLPFDGPLQQCTSWIPEILDFSLAKEDHRTVCAECSWTVFALSDCQAKRKRHRLQL